MRYLNLIYRISVGLLVAFVAYTSYAQSNDKAMYIYCNDGSFNAFLRAEIDSIVPSHYDLDSIYHKDIICQDYHTQDSIYRIPIATIDSVVFRKPEPVYANGVIRIDEWIPYLSEISEDRLALTFTDKLPYTARQGDVLFYPVWDDDRFPIGFAGKVTEVKRVNGITFECDSAMIYDIFEQLVMFSDVIIAQEPDQKPMLKSADIGGEINSTTKFNLDYKNDNFELHETTTFGARLKLLLRLERGRPLFTQISLGGSVGLDLNLAAHFDSGQIQIPDNNNIGKFMTKPFVDLPIDQMGLVRFKVRAAPIMKAQGKAEFEANLHASTGFNVDVTYSDGVATSVPTCNSDCSWDASLNLDGSLFMGVRLYPYIAGIANTFMVSFKIDAGPRVDGNFYIKDGSDVDIYDSLKESKATLYAGATFHIKPQFKVFNWSTGEEETLPQFSQDLFFRINDWYLLPLFSKPEVSYNIDTSTASAHSVPSRNLLMPVKVGLGIHDKSGKLIERKYCINSYRKESDWNSLDLFHQFAGLENDNYTIYPYVNVLGFDIKAKPSADIEKSEDNGDDSDNEAVDLGLSVKWATHNIGASTPYDYGYYFAWGETSPKSSFTEENSKLWKVPYSTLQSQGVIDSNGNLTPRYDAASVHWGGSWRMPTLNEIRELLNSCKWVWTTECGIKGYKIIGPNGNFIFLPATGYCCNDEIYDIGIEVEYWSSTTDNENENYCFAYSLVIPSYLGYLRNACYPGQTIRPVTE